MHPTTVEGIKSEMYKNIPMEAAFTVSNDFLNYKSRVYVPDTSQVLLVATPSSALVVRLG